MQQTTAGSSDTTCCTRDPNIHTNDSLKTLQTSTGHLGRLEAWMPKMSASGWHQTPRLLTRTSSGTSTTSSSKEAATSQKGQPRAQHAPGMLPVQHTLIQPQVQLLLLTHCGPALCISPQVPPPQNSLPKRVATLSHSLEGQLYSLDKNQGRQTVKQCNKNCRQATSLDSAGALSV